MLIKPNIRSIAVFGVAFAVVLPMSGQVLAQTVFTKRQIVQQLQIAPNANFNQNDRVRLKRAPTLRRRAPL